MIKVSRKTEEEQGGLENKKGFVFLGSEQR